MFAKGEQIIIAAKRHLNYSLFIMHDSFHLGVHMTAIQEKLISLSEPGYRDFMAPLLPNLPRERILGVRTPALRSYAKEL